MSARLTAEELAQIRAEDERWDPGPIFYNNATVLPLQRRGLLRELDALTAERDKLAAALREMAGMKLESARAEGFHECREAAIRICGPRNTVMECIEAIRKLKPPSEHNADGPPYRGEVAADLVVPPSHTPVALHGVRALEVELELDIHDWSEPDVDWLATRTCRRCGVVQEYDHGPNNGPTIYRMPGGRSSNDEPPCVAEAMGKR